MPKIFFNLEKKKKSFFKKKEKQFLKILNKYVNGIVTFIPAKTEIFLNIPKLSTNTQSTNC